MVLLINNRQSSFRNVFMISLKYKEVESVNFLLTLLIGIIAGVVDVLPMIKMKVDKYSCLSAFVYYLIIPFIIFEIGRAHV